MHTFFFNLNKGSDVKSISITKNLILCSTRIQNSMLLRDCLEFMFFYLTVKTQQKTANDPVKKKEWNG